MAKPRSITIKLTEKQRSQLRSLTGERYESVEFEAAPTVGRVGPRKVASRSVGKAFVPRLRKYDPVEWPDR